MQEFNFQNFLQNIEEDLKEAGKLVRDLGDNKLYGHFDEDTFFDEKKDFNEYLLNYYIKRAIIKVKFALEYLKLDNLLKEFNSVIDKYKSYNKFEYVSYADVLVNPVVGHIHDYVDAITSQLDPKLRETAKIEEDKSLLERILSGTPKLIFDQNLEPKNEAEIKNVVYKFLIHIFPDTVREIPISKVSKVYKPDLGIRKLKTAIEYKFVDSLEEMKISIGGIFEDIKGYEGSDDWDTFYAVIYQTDHFMTQAQVDEEFKLSKVEHSWKPILVFGKGKRPKISKAKSRPKRKAADNK